MRARRPEGARSNGTCALDRYFELGPAAAADRFDFEEASSAPDARESELVGPRTRAPLRMADGGVARGGFTGTGGSEASGPGQGAALAKGRTTQLMTHLPSASGRFSDGQGSKRPILCWYHRFCAAAE